jgi:hypothetical protein
MLQAGMSPVRVPDEVDFFNPSSRTMALGSTQPLTEMRNLPGCKKRPALTIWPFVSGMSENVVASTSRNPKDLHGLCRDNSLCLHIVLLLLIIFVSPINTHEEQRRAL